MKTKTSFSAPKRSEGGCRVPRAGRLLATLAALVLLIPLCGTLNAQLTVDNVLTNGLYEPYAVAVDSENIVYITDSASHRVVRFDPNAGVSTTVAGIAGEAGNNDGPSYLAHFNSPQGIVLATVGGVAGLIVGDTGNHLIRFVNLADGTISTLAGTGAAGNLDAAVGTSAKFRSPIGLALDTAGILYIADSQNNLIRQINLADPNFGVTTFAVSGTTFRQPNGVAILSTNQIWVADTRNHAIKLITRTGPTSGTLTTLMGSNDQGVTGSANSSFGANARFNNPRGVLWLGAAGLVIADTANQTVRLATNNPVFGTTNYGVLTLAGVAGQSGFVNGPALSAKFSGPHGLARDALGNGFMIADLANNAIRRIQTGPAQPPVETPQIGWVDFVLDAFGALVSILRTDQPFVFNNDVKIAVLTEDGTETFYTFGATPPSPVEDTIPSPNHNSGSTPPHYENGLRPSEVPDSMVQPQPDLTVKVISTQDGRQSSPVVQARFQFKTANPSIAGDNVASFVVSDQTFGATMWYTIDGTEPTNARPSLGPIKDDTTLSFDPGGSNLVFKVRAFRDHYKESSTVTKVFSPTNFIPNRITFGFASGEASSDFIASPGQLFYAPVTLSILPGAKMYSLQFNLTVTNAGPNPGPPVTAGAVRFESLLQKPIPNTSPVIYTKIPPAMFLGLITEPEITIETNQVRVFDRYQLIANSLVTNWFSTNDLITTITNGNRLITNYVVATGFFGTNVVGELRTETNLLNVTTYSTNVPAGVGHSFKVETEFVTLGLEEKFLAVPSLVTNIVLVPPFSNPPPDSKIIFPFDGFEPFVDLTFTNQSLNLLGVGWLERFTKKSLYDTTLQDLIKFSQPHDTLFLEEGGSVVVGAYAFQVPSTATIGQTYQIQIGRPSATSDGIGAPGSDVYISTPTNGSLTAGAINAIKNVTTGQRKYIVGDVYPFRWFNAGDFGKGHLANADVMQAFQAAIYELNYPPSGSDFFDAMDSCGFNYAVGSGYLKIDPTPLGPSELNPLFGGDDTTINQMAFGDGALDVCDVYVTFRRSLDPSLVWFRRFWTNDAGTAFRAAEIVGNNPLPGRLSRVTSSNPPAVRFGSADLVASAGQTLTIPITAQISGTYPLRTLILNLSVKALDGSPALTSPIQFTPNPALGPPTLTDSKGKANYAATWLDSTISGLTGNATLGTLTVHVPATAGGLAAYVVHFDHASASPNGLASFPKQTDTGLITLSDRSASSWNDGIADSWRLRNFGSLDNVLSKAAADADGDGADNLQEFKAGTDPNDTSSVLRLKSNVGQPRECVVRWPSVSGKQYVLERAASIYSPSWSPVSTNNGTGWDLEYRDTGAGTPSRFYRVRVLE